MKKLIFLLLLVVIVLLGFLINWPKIPSHWNPRAPLTINQPINIVTRWKLNRLKQNPSECISILADIPSDQINYELLEDHAPVKGCPLTNVLKIKNTGLDFNKQFVLSCPLAIRWLMFELQGLQPAARKFMNASIVKVDHYGSFSCRNINSKAKGRLSEHATASAFDIAGFKLSDDRTVSVLKHWDNQSEQKKSEFLVKVRNEACSFFGTVLGPEYNSNHLNHFHIDNKNTLICR